MDNYNASLIERIDITPRLAIIRVKPDAEKYDFTAGQYTVLGLAGKDRRVAEAEPEEKPAVNPEKIIKRAYSLTSSSNNHDYLEFYISLVTSGELTPRLFYLNEGDRLFVGPSAKGLFTLDSVPRDKNIIMVATGTGLAPYVSMLRSNVINRPKQSVAIIHGSSYSWDLGYRGELEVMSRNSNNISYIPIVSRPEEDRDWRGRTGRLTPWLSGDKLGEICRFDADPETTHIFLCGNPGMVEDAKAMFEKQGFDRGSKKSPGNLHLEKYW